MQEEVDQFQTIGNSGADGGEVEFHVPAKPRALGNDTIGEMKLPIVIYELRNRRQKEKRKRKKERKRKRKKERKKRKEISSDKDKEFH
jgi:hypothetical protein